METGSKSDAGVIGSVEQRCWLRGACGYSGYEVGVRVRRLAYSLAAVALAACGRYDRVAPLQDGVSAPPITLPASQHDISPPLREMVSIATRGIADEEDESASAAGPISAARGVDSLLGVRPAVLTANPFTVLQSFDAITTAELAAAGLDGNFAADSSGAVGPNHYVHSANFGFKIFDKSGNVLVPTSPTAAFWAGFAPCGGGWSDTVILYDRAADRFFVSRFAQDAAKNWYQCFAISSTPDPTGSYNRYAFLVSATEFNDYPKFGIWPDAYYMTAQRNKIFPGTGLFVEAFERSQMLLGQPAQAVLFVLDNNGNRAGMLPADWDGQTPPPPGAPNPMIRPTSAALGWAADSLEQWNFHVDWANTAASTLTLARTIPVPVYQPACGKNQNCVPQPSTATGLDPLSSGYLMYRLAYRNFGDHEAMVANHTVDAGDLSPAVHVAVRWYELRNDAPGWSIFQDGTWAPDADHRWIGSMAMDRAGDIALGYNLSGSVFPSIAFAGRKPGDPAGSFSQEATLKAGGGSLSFNGNNFVGWGDYSQVTLDPVDDCTFWYVASYQRANSLNAQDWTTHVGAFRSADCARATTSITYTGATTEDFHDETTLSATLTNTFAGLPVPGATLAFQLGAQLCIGVTDAVGSASCKIILDQAAGSYALTVDFAGDAQLATAHFGGTFEVTREETTLVYAGATVFANGGTAQLAAILREDGAVPIAGRTILFTLGSGASAQSCSGTTDATGTATCSIAPVNQPLGPEPITATFAGDGFYLPASASADAIAFAFLASGAFVVGDKTATGAVTFWSAEWATANSLSGGPVPDAFKGFAAAPAAEPPTCGTSWTTRPGNSSGPPATVPSYMGVIVAASVVKTGAVISGNAPAIVVVRVDPGYAPTPGHAGTGKVVAQYCP